MQNVTITQVETRDITTVRGPAKKVGIKTNVHGDKWLGAFVNKYNEKELTALHVGQKVAILVETSPDGKYLNFKLPSKLDLIEERLRVVEQKLGISEKEADAGLDDVNPDDIPF